MTLVRLDPKPAKKRTPKEQAALEAARKAYVITPEEDEAITAGALADADNPPLTDAEIDAMRPARGRPRGTGKKEKVTVSLDSDLVALLRASGSGWQTRANNALRSKFMGKR